MEEEGEIDRKENFLPYVFFSKPWLTTCFCFPDSVFYKYSPFYCLPFYCVCQFSWNLRSLQIPVDLFKYVFFLPLCFLNSLQKKNWNFFLNSLMNPLSFPPFQILSCNFIIPFIRTFWSLPSWLLYMWLNVPFLLLALLRLKTQTRLPIVFVTFTLPIYLTARINLKNSSFPHCLFYLQHNLHSSIKRSLFHFIFL